jgi:ribosomal protein L2
MDTRGAPHLRARLSAGAAVGERVEVVSVDPGAAAPVAPGDEGRVVAIDEELVLVRLDSGAEHAFDPTQVRLRRVA